ncbi:MAG: TonB-dependent receptor plug domain-containing protein [Bdellovibrionota bacterium]
MRTATRRFRVLWAAFLSIASLTFALSAFAADDSLRDVGDLSIEDLLNTEVAVASFRKVKAREAPGVVTVVTREQLQASGARDLLDALQLIPGFFIGSDVSGVAGPGFRGIWGYEGKILLLWDGHEINELSYGTLQLGGHFPVDLIERIEVIRGPGSAIYGGMAEIAVINVVTRSAGDFEGVSVSIGAGATEDIFTRRAASLSFGSLLSGDWRLGGALSVSTVPRSDQTFTDFSGASFDMERDSGLENVHASLSLSSERTKVRLLFDDYNVWQRTSYGANLPQAIPLGFRSFFADASHKLRLGEGLSMEPSLGLTRQSNWHSRFGTDATDDDHFDVVVWQLRAGLPVSWEITDWAALLAGAEYELTYSKYGPTVTENIYPDGTDDIGFSNLSLFGEGSIQHEIANATVGARFEYHEQYGASFVPRVALTRQFERFHLKGLFSQAFHAPTIENLSTNPGLDPERTTVFEAEGGWKIADGFLLTVNFFDITLKKPIVYDIAGGDLYQNFSKTGSRGIEAEFRSEGKWASLWIGYSFYTTASKNKVPLFDVPGENGILLAAANHKVTFTGSIPVYKGFYFDPSFVFLSDRWGYFTATPLSPKTFGPAYLLNLQLRCEDLLIDGLSARFSIHNVLGDKDDVYIQPYLSTDPGGFGQIAPIPALSREFLLRLAYEWEKPKAATPSDVIQ